MSDDKDRNEEEEKRLREALKRMTPEQRAAAINYVQGRGQTKKDDNNKTNGSGSK